MRLFGVFRVRKKTTKFGSSRDNFVEFGFQNVIFGLGYRVAYQSSLIVNILLTALYLDIEDAHNCVSVGEAEFCYYTSGRYFGSANEFCKTKKGQLTSIASAAEQTAVNNLINSSAGGTDWTWIGYIDNEATGINWNFIDGKGGYTNWDDGQPGEPVKQLCGVIKKSTGKWHDVVCNQKYSFVCRIVSYSIVLI